MIALLAAVGLVAGCPVFPATNAWNQRVDRLPVAADSSQLIRSIGPAAALHPDFGSGLWDGGRIGIPYDVVSKTAPRSHVRFRYAAESDTVAYPIPRGVHIESGSDRHAILLDRSACKLYELYALRRSGGRWTAGSGAVFDLRSNRCARRAGRPPTPPGCRSSLGSRATTTSPAA